MSQAAAVVPPASLVQRVVDAGNEVRRLKAAGEAIDAALAELQAAKKAFKDETGAECVRVLAPMLARVQATASVGLLCSQCVLNWGCSSTQH